MGESETHNTERPWETKSSKLLILAQRTAPRESRRTAHRSLGNGLSGLSVQLSCLACFCHGLTAFTNKPSFSFKLVLPSLSSSRVRSTRKGPLCPGDLAPSFLFWRRVPTQEA